MTKINQHGQLKKIRTWILLSAFILALLPGRKLARAVECTDILHIVKSQGHMSYAHSDWQNMGRLADLARVLVPGDSAAIKLLFVGTRSSYSFARRKLREHGAHFIRTQLAEFQPLRSFWKSLQFDPIGSGQFELRITKDELTELRPYLELANQIELEDVVGIENDDHVLKGRRSFDDRVDRHEIDYWKWLKARPDHIVQVQTLTSYDKKTFQSVVDRLAKFQDRVHVKTTHYDPLLSIGYMTLEGTPSDLPRIIEDMPEVHMVRVLAAEHMRAPGA